jgi:hypothetical protein
MERRYETRTNGYDTMCHDDECAISNRVLGELAKRGGAEACTVPEGASTVASEPREARKQWK